MKNLPALLLAVLLLSCGDNKTVPQNDTVSKSVAENKQDYCFEQYEIFYDTIDGEVEEKHRDLRISITETGPDSFSGSVFYQGATHTITEWSISGGRRQSHSGKDEKTVELQLDLLLDSEVSGKLSAMKVRYNKEGLFILSTSTFLDTSVTLLPCGK